MKSQKPWVKHEKNQKVLQSICTHTQIWYKLWNIWSSLAPNSLCLFYYNLMKNSFKKYFTVCNE